MRIQQTPQQRANTLDALHNMWPSVPERNVSPGLKEYRHGEIKNTNPDCDTIACFSGWCALWPPFVAQGIAPTVIGSAYHVASGGDGMLFLFGFSGLLLRRSSITIDAGFTGTDHACVTNRLKWLLENSEVVGCSVL